MMPSISRRAITFFLLFPARRESSGIVCQMMPRCLTAYAAEHGSVSRRTSRTNSIKNISTSSGLPASATSDCNLCYAASNSEHAVEQLTPEEIFRIGRQIKKQAGYAIVLSGGEPTLHPELFTVISGLTKIGLEVSLATNGYRISTEPGFAKQLKSAGLQQINLSFDTLKQETQKIYRNNTWVKEKIEAIESARDARLRVIAIATMSKYNIDETGELIAFLTGYAPAVSVAILQPYFFSVNQRDKNELFNEEKIVKREEIIHALVRSGAIAGLSQDHFWPFPQFNLALHPDCAAIAILVS